MIMAAFVAHDEPRFAAYVAKTLGPGFTAAQAADLLHRGGHLGLTMSAELRVARLEDLAEEREASAKAMGLQRTRWSAECAGSDAWGAAYLRDAATKVREPTSWDDRPPFSGRAAGTP